MSKLIIFSSDSLYSYILLKPLILTNSNDICCIYLSKSLKKQNTKRFLYNKLLCGLGFRYYAFTFTQNILSKLNKKSLSFIAKQYHIPVKYVSNINDDNFIREVEETKPSLIICTYFDQIIRKRLLEIPLFGVINVHPSLLPSYRGVKPVFWVLKNSEPKTGITIHMMDEGIDTGDILVQKEIEISMNDSFHSLMKRLSLEGSVLLEQALLSIKENNCTLRRQNSTNNSYYGQPTSTDLRDFLAQGRKLF